ncbi:ATP-binding protein [Streptomyces sp. NPDC002004]
MACVANGLTKTPPKGLRWFAGLCPRLGRLWLRKPSGPARTPGAETNSEIARTSWLTRQLALWSRIMEPLRPLDVPVARTSAWDASWPLRRDPISVRRARRLVTARLSDWDMSEVADTVELLASELVTNALRHTRGPLRLNMRMSSARLRCEVEDTSPACPVRRTADPDAEGGRGTELLDLLAEAWDSSRTGAGKTTWFELTVPATRTARAQGMSRSGHDVHAPAFGPAGVPRA